MDCDLDTQVREVTDDWRVDTRISKTMELHDSITYEKLGSLKQKYSDELAKAKKEFEAADKYDFKAASNYQVAKKQSLPTLNNNFEPLFIKQTPNSKLDVNEDYSKFQSEIEDYTGTGYTELAAARKGEVELDIQKFLDDQPENIDGNFYRGSRIDEKQFAAVKNSMATGSLLGTKVPISSSKDFEVATNFVKGDLMKGRRDLIVYFKSKGHNIQRFSGLSGEQEVLLNSNKIFQVLSYKDTKLQVHIMLEEVRPEIFKLMQEAGTNLKVDKSVLGIAGIGLGLGASATNKDDKSN